MFALVILFKLGKQGRSFLNTKYAKNAKQRLFEAENSLKKSFVTNKLCLFGFIVKIINLLGKGSKIKKNKSREFSLSPRPPPPGGVK